MTAPKWFSASSPNLQGACWMLLGAGTFVAMTSLVKYLGDYPATLQTFFRWIVGLVVLAPFIARRPREILYTGRMPLLLFRGSVSSVAMVLQFYSFSHLPLAEANALAFTRPLWVAPLAAIVLREVVGVPRIVAVLVGFGGVLVMLQPWSRHTPIGLAQGAALLAALLQAVTITGVKSLTRDHSPMSLVVWSVIMGTVFTFPFAMMAWRWPSAVDFGLLAVMGVLGIANSFLYTKAMTVGDAAVMAPLDYSRLIISVTVGLLIFHEIPSALTLVGALIIAASTLWITWREEFRARRARLLADI